MDTTDHAKIVAATLWLEATRKRVGELDACIAQFSQLVTVCKDSEMKRLFETSIADLEKTKAALVGRVHKGDAFIASLEGSN